MIWRSESIILPPLFYLIAAEKEQLKTFGRWCTSKFQFCRNNSVYPLVVWIRIAPGLVRPGDVGALPLLPLLYITTIVGAMCSVAGQVKWFHGRGHPGKVRTYVHVNCKCIPSWSFADSIVEIKCDAIFCSIYLKLVIHQRLWFINKTLLLCWHIPRISIYPMTTWECNTTALPHTFSVSSGFMIYPPPQNLDLTLYS